MLVFLEAVFFYIFENAIIEDMTNLDNLKDLMHIIYIYFAINVIPDSIRGSLKGVFRALGR